MTTARPVVFIHGLWLHTSSWAPWVDLFREARVRARRARLARRSRTRSPRRAERRRASPVTASTTSPTHYAAIIAGCPRSRS